MPRESTITAAIKRTAESLGWWVMKIHGGPMQLSGVPDLLCLRNGRAVFLEVKQPGKKATPLQVRRMAEIAAKGGVPCYVVTNTDEAVLYLGIDEPRSACTGRCRPFTKGIETR